jgi:hypothetical protein
MKPPGTTNMYLKKKGKRKLAKGVHKYRGFIVTKVREMRSTYEMYSQNTALLLSYGGRRI